LLSKVKAFNDGIDISFREGGGTFIFFFNVNCFIDIFLGEIIKRELTDSILGLLTGIFLIKVMFFLKFKM
jgi:hypothetical protein